MTGRASSSLRSRRARRHDPSAFRVLSLLIVMVLFVAANAVVLGFLAPPDAVQGQWQRMMYVHAPAAWTAYLGFAGVTLCSAAYLYRPTPRWSRWAVAAAEVGVAFTALTLVSGSVWGRAVWGTWWAWDPRLVSTALLFVLYTGYLALGGLAGSGRARRRVAWFGALGFLLVPVVHFSVVWWRTLHQTATVLGPLNEPRPLDARMACALALSLLAFTGAGAVAWAWRAGLLPGGALLPTRAATRAVPPPVSTPPVPHQSEEPVGDARDPLTQRASRERHSEPVR